MIMSVSHQLFNIMRAWLGTYIGIDLANIGFRIVVIWEQPENWFLAGHVWIAIDLPTI